MQISRDTRINRRRNWLNAFMAGATVALTACLVMLGVLVSRPSEAPQATITVSQADKVSEASSFLQSVGFNNPMYRGITPGTEGEYPTFRATAIGGKSVDLWIRTSPDGGWEIQPVMIFETIASADAFARLAQKSVSDWQHMPSDIKPRTDGSYGEWENRKYMYDQLSKYNPDQSYWEGSRNETSGWPAK